MDVWNSHICSTVCKLPPWPRFDATTAASLVLTTRAPAEPHLVVSGSSGGAVALYDSRLPAAQARVGTWREHQAYVVTAQMRAASHTLAVTGE